MYRLCAESVDSFFIHPQKTKNRVTTDFIYSSEPAGGKKDSIVKKKLNKTKQQQMQNHPHLLGTFIYNKWTNKSAVTHFLRKCATAVSSLFIRCESCDFTHDDLISRTMM